MTDAQRTRTLFGAALLLLLGVDGASPAMAQDVTSTKPVTSSVLLALPPGSISTVAPGPCAPGEQVALAGNVHVVTLVRQGMLTQVHLNLAGVQGIGQITGNLYIGTGSQKFSYVAQSIAEVPPVLANFALEHTDGCANDTLPVGVVLKFNASGTLDPAGTAPCSGGCTPILQ